MIDPSELRIGNWVVGFDNKPHQWTLKDFANLNTGIVSIDEYIKSPVPLTEEWLVKFGFELDESKKYGEHIGFNEWSLGKFELGNYNDQFFICENIHDRFTELEIKHVHQLQTLYFALTGEELTIKDEEE